MGVRLALVLAFGASLAGALACAPAQAPVTATVSLRMRGTPADATVTIDDQNIGQLDYVAARGVALPLGVHHITVQAPGYFPLDREVDAKSQAAPIDVVVKLVPVPD